jgi:hypothetical protein
LAIDAFTVAVLYSAASHHASESPRKPR